MFTKNTCIILLYYIVLIRNVMNFDKFTGNKSYDYKTRLNTRCIMDVLNI